MILLSLSNVSLNFFVEIFFLIYLLFESIRSYSEITFTLFKQLSIGKIEISTCIINLYSKTYNTIINNKNKEGAIIHCSFAYLKPTTHHHK